MQAQQIQRQFRKKLFLSGLFLYLFAIIGIFAPLHQHHDSEESHFHSDCQLCLVGSQVYLAPVIPLLGSPVSIQINVLVDLPAPILMQRYSAYSSRGPPAT